MSDSRTALPTVWFLAGSLVALPLAAASAEKASSATPVVGLRSPQELAQFHVLAGEMAAGRNLPETAAQEFLKALDYQPDGTLAARATAYALASRRDDLAMTAARRWLEAVPSAMEAREVIAVLSLKAGDSTEAQAQCLAIISGHPGGEDDGYRHVALVLAQEKSTAQPAITLLKTLAADKPQSAAAQRALALLAYRFDDLDTAEKAARESLRLAPNEREGTLLLVGTLVKKGNVAEANGLMDGLLAGQKDSRELRLGYARLLIDADQRPEAREQLLAVLKADAANGDAHFALGLLALDARAFDEAEKHFLVLLDNPERSSDAEYYLGRLAEIRQQPEQALAHYERVSSGNQALDAFVRRARLLTTLKRVPEAREVLASLRAQYPPLASRLTATEGELLADSGNLTEALSVYDDALKLSPDDTDLLYGRAMLHERMNRFELSETDLRKLLGQSPDDVRALNALGYLLTVHTSRLDEAAKLIGKAYAAMPNDPAIIDSMGWVLFKQGKPHEALPLLQKAMDLYPDSEVAAHLGEVLWALGEHDKALAVLTKAQQLDPDRALLRATLQRLQNKH